MERKLDIFQIKTNNIKPQKGKVLIAEPFLPGSYFSRSIVYLVDHNEKGSVGFILNKPVDFSVDELHEEMPGFDLRISLGGPVSVDSLYFIHTLGEKVPESIPITDDLYWGGNFDVLKNLINAGEVSSNEIRFFMGYSGWGEGQLTEEINEDSWLVYDVSRANVMNDKEHLWIEMVKQVGGRYSLWENFPENPSFN